MDSETQNVAGSQDTTALLAQLKGIQLPEAPVSPSLWPLYLCLAVCAAALVVFAIRHYKRKRTWHRPALKKLKEIQRGSTAESLQQTAVLLKRIALTEGNREAIQHLNGERWLQYLDRFFNTDYFSSGNGRIFGNALYQPDAFADQNLHNDLGRLIKQHSRRQS